MFASLREDGYAKGVVRREVTVGCAELRGGHQVACRAEYRFLDPRNRAEWAFLSAFWRSIYEIRVRRCKHDIDETYLSMENCIFSL